MVEQSGRAKQSGFSLRRLIFWDYPRASWQYDIIVALILAFIFLTPRAVFRDQPRPKNIVLLAAEGGGGAFWIEPELLHGVPAERRLAEVERLVKGQPGNKSRQVVRVEPIFDDEQEVRGFLAHLK